MTPIRETIARAISPYYWAAAATARDTRAKKVHRDRSLFAADRVLSALDEAGCVVARKDASDAMVWAGCTEIVRAQGRECKRCPPVIDTPYGAGTQACRLEAEDIYRVMIAASVVE